MEDKIKEYYFYILKNIAYSNLDYIGVTTQNLKYRLGQHFYVSKLWDSRLSIALKTTQKCNWKIDLIVSLKCFKKEAFEIENKLIKELKPNLYTFHVNELKFAEISNVF